MILVTGAAGLVGSELIAQLSGQGEQIRALYNKTKPEILAGVEYTCCSVLDIIGLQEAMQHVDEVYHCAGLVSFTKGDTELLYKINVEGTANIVNVALEGGVAKLVHISSVAAIGRLRDGTVNEAMQWTPETSNSQYGKTKYLGELEVWRGIAEGLQATIVNPSIILGNGNWQDGSTGIFKSAYNEFPWYTDGVSGFVDVRDVAKAMMLLMHSDISGERFILSAHNKTYREVFSKIAEAFQKKPPVKKVTPLIAALVWRLQALKSLFTNSKPLLTKETAATALAKVQYDNSKLLRMLPSFSYRAFDETIEDTCRLLQQKLNKQ
ncbi:MAG: NAD-dependent epimerase/dehydratase family protein [Ferruginibacter sp.]